MSIQIIREKFLSLQVCAPKHMSREEVEREANAKSESGTTAGWVIHHEVFPDGSTNPCKCAEDPERQHWVLVC